MRAWGDGGEESQRANWQLVTFIRHLPQLSAEEKLEMERLNPKGPAEWRELQEDEEFLQGKEAGRPLDHRDGAHRHRENQPGRGGEQRPGPWSSGSPRGWRRRRS